MRKKTGGYLTYLLHFSDVKIHYLQRENVKIKRDDDDTVRFLPCDLKVKSIIVVTVIYYPVLAKHYSSHC